jgi:hypothetical protein
MPLVGHRQAERRLLSRRGAVAFLAIAALTVSLASRVPHATIFKAAVAHSEFSSVKIQHRDNDASHWVAPLATVTLLWTAEASVILHGDQEVPVRLQDDSLHNRPPPVS